mmetsp:Transcript_35988/g.77843  ORF Transcript_35988/g.77843 Transcript_35988/m.77843 type:complete len:754 (-) Transcript_35988:449-2710(-)
MKFGKQLENLVHPRYRGHYIQYKELKKALKVWTGMDKEQSTVQEVTHWASSFLRLGPNPEVSPEMRLNESLRHEMERISKFAELEETTIRSQLKALQEEVKASRTAPADAMKRLEELGDQIVQLKSYTQLNFSGFRKILKKYDKCCSGARVSPWFMAEVARAPFMKINYDSLLQLVNAIASALASKSPSATGGAAVASGEMSTRPRLGSGTWESTLKGGKEAVFLVDAKDTMQVRVLLALYFYGRQQKGAAPSGAVPESIPTSCCYFDTPDYQVYQSTLPSTTSATLPSMQIRYNAGEAVMLSVDAPLEGGTEILLTRAEAANLASTGTASLPRSIPAVAARSIEGLRPPNTNVAQAQGCLKIAQRLVKQEGHVPIVQASFARQFYQDRSGSFQVSLDEEVRMSKAAGGLFGKGQSPEWVPQAIITVSSSSPVMSSDGMEWLQHLQERTNLLHVSGFSLAALGIAHFYAKDRGFPQPIWYHNIMKEAEDYSDVPEGPGSGTRATSEAGSQEDKAPSSSAAAAAAAAAPVLSSSSISAAEMLVPKTGSGLKSKVGHRLLHDFGGEGEPLPTPPSRIEEEGGRVAAPVGGLSAPLLANSGDDEGAEATPKKAGVGQLASDFFMNLVGFGPKKVAPPTDVDAELKPVRYAIVAVQPKTLYSNERTFLEWMHFATLLATSGVVMMHGMSGVSSKILARFIVLVAIFLAFWSFKTFNWRADALDEKTILDYQDPIGPAVVVMAMLVGLLGTTMHALSL